MRWSYKTVHYELKKEGLLGNSFLDEVEVEESLNEFGHAGWELVSLIEVKDGLIGVLKQPLEDQSYRTQQINDDEPAFVPVAEKQPVAKTTTNQEPVEEVILLEEVEDEYIAEPEQNIQPYEEESLSETFEEESDEDPQPPRKIGEIRIE